MAGMTIAMSHAPADEVLAQSNDGTVSIATLDAVSSTLYSEMPGSESPSAQVSETGGVADLEAEGQWIAHYYLHPFLPMCFWYCTRIPIFCPCHEIYL